MSETAQRIGERLLEARKRAGMTQAEVGDALGIGKWQVLRHESGKQSMSIDRLYEYADLYRVPVSELTA